MQRISCSLLTLSVTLLAANVLAGDIQQVSCNSGCGVSSCTPEGCNSRRDRTPRSRSKRARNGDYCDAGRSGDCQNGRCGLRGSARDFVLDWAGQCSVAGRMARRGCPLAQKAVWCCKTKAYPDSGWAPPANVPVRRTGGAYGAQWGNNAGGGYGPGAPMVYQPTDTTQLGYSYSNVPTWRPNRNMIPAVPNPSNFHNRVCPSRGYDACPAGFGNYMMESSCENCDMGYVSLRNPGAAAQMAAFHGVRPTMIQPRPQVAVKPAQPKAPKIVQAPVAKSEPAKLQLTNNTQVTPPKSFVAPKPAAAKQPWVQQTQQQNVRRATTQRPGKRTVSPQAKSRGWLGLPSLSEMTL